MNEDRRRFQCSLRDLLEIVFWLSAGMAAINAVVAIGAAAQSPSTFVVVLLLILSMGASFGVAAGVPGRKRAEMMLPGVMLAGLIAWPVALMWMY